MQAVAQHHLLHTPSIRQALTALLLTALVVILGLAVVGSRVSTPENYAAATRPSAVLPDSSRSTARANASATADAATPQVALWPSDTMDSHESIPSLAALTKTSATNAGPL